MASLIQASRPGYYKTVVKLRIVAERLEEDKTRYTSACQIAEFCRRIGLNQEAQEVGIIIFLDCKQKINGYIEISRGSIDSTIIQPREVFKAAILLNCSRIIFVHNHPSGEIEASQEDKNVTRGLATAGRVLGIELLDSIIIGGGNTRYYSFKQSGGDL